jgi:16S rRNA (uracil1498-N3)-methyltransferase
MSYPFFYLPDYNGEQTEFVLTEDNSRHIVQVLRMKPGDRLFLTDGKGHLLTVSILDDHKKKCSVRVETITRHPRPENHVVIAISLLKNAGRFEWFLEKAMEIGVTGIIPLLSERTEKQHFRQDRMQNILVSALLQSRQTWLPDLSEPLPFDKFLASSNSAGVAADRKYIAHCVEERRLSLADEVRNGKWQGRGSSLVLIGPEGDFTSEEIGAALQQGFLPVTLGETRLRTETAGMVAATLLCIGTHRGDILIPAN